MKRYSSVCRLVVLVLLCCAGPAISAQESEAVQAEFLPGEPEGDLAWLGQGVLELPPEQGENRRLMSRGEAARLIAAMNAGEAESLGYQDWRNATWRELLRIFRSEGLMPPPPIWPRLAQYAGPEDAGSSWLLEHQRNPSQGLTRKAAWRDDAEQVYFWPVRTLTSSGGFGDVVVLAENSAYLKKNSAVLSGDVVVNDASPGPTLACSGAELCVGVGSATPGGFAVKADSIQIKSNADLLGQAFCNELNNNGNDPGLTCVPLDQPGDLPVFASLPPFETVNGSGMDVTVESGDTQILTAGDYGVLKVKQNGAVVFSGGGVFSFSEIDVGLSCDLTFDAAADIRVSGKLLVDKNSTVNSPANVPASEIIFFVAGVNGSSGNLGATPKAAKLGVASLTEANFYVPNGTLWIRQNAYAKGAFLARDVIVGIGAEVELDSFFGNEPPEAMDDTADVDEGGMVTIDVLANDSDPNGDPLTLTPTPVSGPANGTAVLMGTAFKYTHDGGETTSDSFVYEVCDPDSLCDAATVVITVAPVNDPPEAGDDMASVDEGAMLIIDVLANDSDPEDDPLVLTAAPVSGPSNGSVTLMSGVFKYTHDGSETLSDSFVYEVCDTGTPVECDTASVSITINPVNDAPLAVADSYSAFGNTELIVATVLPSTPHITDSPGVLANDSDVDGPMALQVVPGTFASVNGGEVLINANGSFAYRPPSGFEGNDSFSYSVTDGADISAGTVSISITESVWYVDNTNGGPGDGRSHNPFRSLKAVESASGAGAGDTIFVHRGDGSNAFYDEGLVLKDAQRLIGQGEALVVGGLTLVASDASGNPRLSNTAGHGIALAEDNLIVSITVENTSGAGIIGTNVGTLTISDAIVDDAGGPAADLNNGSLDVTFDTLSSSGSSSTGLRVTNSAGSFTVLEDTSVTSANGDGVVLQDNPFASFAFHGLTVSNNGGDGLRASNSGVLTLGSTANTVDTTSGSGVIIDATTLGTGGATFLRISVDGMGGADPAIVLADIGSQPFSVTGTGTTAGSGGSIENMLADGVRLNNTGGPVMFKNMIFEDIGSTAGGQLDVRSGHDAIHGQDVNGGLTIDNTTIRRLGDQAINGSLLADGVSATFWNGLQILNSTIEDANRWHINETADSQADMGMVRIVGLTGSVVVSNSTLRRGVELLDFTTHSSGTLDMTVTNSSFDEAFKEFTTGAVPVVGRLCIDVTVEGASAANVTIGDQTNAALGNAFLNCGSGSVRATKGVGAAGNANVDVIVSRNSFRVNDHSSTMGSSGNFPQGGVALRAGPGGISTFDALVSHNTFGVAVGPDDRMGSTTDEIMNADGLVGNLALVFESGAGQARVADNQFNGSINAPWFVRADNNISAAVLFQDNTYRGRDDFFSPDPGFGTFTVPGIPYRTRVRGGGSLDISFQNDNFVHHDQFFLANTENLEFEVLNLGPGGSGSAPFGGTLCVSLDSVVSPDGLEFEEQTNGAINLFQGAANNAATGPCTAGAGGDCEAELADDGVRGGPNNRDAATGTPDSALNPPFVDVDAGSVSITGTACTLPAGGPF